MRPKVTFYNARVVTNVIEGNKCRSFKIETEESESFWVTAFESPEKGNFDPYKLLKTYKVGVGSVLILQCRMKSKQVSILTKEEKKELAKVFPEITKKLKPHDQIFFSLEEFGISQSRESFKNKPTKGGE